MLVPKLPSNIGMQAIGKGFSDVRTRKTIGHKMSWHSICFHFFGFEQK